MSNEPIKKNNNMPDDKAPKTNYFWIYGALGILLLIILFSKYFTGGELKETNQTTFEKYMLLQNDVDKIVVVNDHNVEVFIKKDSLKKPFYTEVSKVQTFGTSNPGPHFFFTVPDGVYFREYLDKLKEKTPSLTEVSVQFDRREDSLGKWLQILVPIFLLIAFWTFMTKRMGGPGGQIFNIGKSRATLFDNGKQTNITFADVAGLDEEKEEVMEIVNFLKEPKKYTALGGKIPKGALLVGPPGTGKTLLAKAMAGEAKVPFFSISGSDFVEMFVGVGASRVRDLFKQAREKAPCVIFIDEIDAVGRARGKGSINNNDERESTLNQLLVEMDGFSSEKGIIMLAATNRPDVLDDALLRPGRFDRQVTINRPDLKGREEIFNVHLKPIKTGADVDPKKLSEQTPGFVGADIANLCNEAALVAARKNKTEVNQIDFNEAIDKITTGIEKKNKVISVDEKKIIAYHEAGHALTSWFLEYASPFIRVTIIPRSDSLGHALYLPKEKFLTTKEEILDQIGVALGGRAAEQIVYGKISTGALGDLESITRNAYSLVTVYGMSPKLGNISFYKMSQNSYEKPYSEETAKMIDEEARRIVDEQYARVIGILTEKRKELDALANELIQREVLHKTDLEVLLGKRPFDTDEVTTSEPNEAPNEDSNTEAV